MSRADDSPYGSVRVAPGNRRYYSDRRASKPVRDQHLVDEPGDNEDGGRGRKTLMHTGNQRPHRPRQEGAVRENVQNETMSLSSAWLHRQ
jgi:hypothetical protein